MLISLTECHSGTYGQNCTLSCGKCVAKEPCHYVTGACMNGCERGYQGKQCKTGTVYSKIIKRLIISQYWLCVYIRIFVGRNESFPFTMMDKYSFAYIFNSFPFL